MTPQFLASLSTAGGMSPVHEMSDMSKELISFMKTEFDQLDQERFQRAGPLMIAIIFMMGPNYDYNDGHERDLI